jgi:uncharacterized protein
MSANPRQPKTARIAWMLALFSLVFVPWVYAEKVPNLKPQGYVSDFAQVLSPEARGKLTALCTEVAQKAQAQIAVVTVSSLEGVPIEEFSINLATQWGVGPRQQSRGVLILYATGDHQYRVEVGYGLEAILPDGKVGGFGREAVPLLRQNDYDAAILLVTQRVATVIAQDANVTLNALSGVVPEPPGAGPALSPGSFLPILFILIFLFFPVLGFLLRLLFGGVTGNRRGGWGSGPGYYGGGGFGGGGGSGGGFGGFGGGSFGGGGASGSW